MNKIILVSTLGLSLTAAAQQAPAPLLSDKGSFATLNHAGPNIPGLIENPHGIGQYGEIPMISAGNASINGSPAGGYGIFARNYNVFGNSGFAGDCRFILINSAFPPLVSWSATAVAPTPFSYNGKTIPQAGALKRVSALGYWGAAPLPPATPWSKWKYKTDISFVLNTAAAGQQPLSISVISAFPISLQDAGNLVDANGKSVQSYVQLASAQQDSQGRPLNCALSLINLDDWDFLVPGSIQATITQIDFSKYSLVDPNNGAIPLWKLLNF